jgi:hypothetical protein
MSEEAAVLALLNPILRELTLQVGALVVEVRKMREELSLEEAARHPTPGPSPADPDDSEP